MIEDYTSPSLKRAHRLHLAKLGAKQEGLSIPYLERWLWNDLSSVHDSTPLEKSTSTHARHSVYVYIYIYLHLKYSIYCCYYAIYRTT
jgi:hypothetical protein